MLHNSKIFSCRYLSHSLSLYETHVLNLLDHPSHVEWNYPAKLNTTGSNFTVSRVYLPDSHDFFCTQDILFRWYRALGWLSNYFIQSKTVYQIQYTYQVTARIERPRILLIGSTNSRRRKSSCSQEGGHNRSNTLPKVRFCQICWKVSARQLPSMMLKIL